MKKRILTLMLALALSVGIAVPAAASTQFSDVPSTHWAYNEVIEAVNKGITNGYSDGTFKPGNSVTNAHFAAFLARAFYKGEYNDGNASPWYKPYIDVLSRHGILSGTTVGNDLAANINRPINRYDMAQMMYNILVDKEGRMPAEEELSFARTNMRDWAKVPAKYSDAVSVNYAVGTLQGQSDGNFGGLNLMNRAQGCVVISRLQEVFNEASGSQTSQEKPYEEESQDEPVRAVVPSVKDFSPEYMASKYYRALQNVKLTGDYRTDMIAVATSQIGYHEGDAPNQIDGSYNGNGNYSEYGRFLDSNGRAWCSEFASWCARNAGVPTSLLANSRSANVKVFAAPYYSWDKTVYAGGNYTPQAGDLVLFAWNGTSETSNNLSHTAIVHSVQRNGSNVILTVIHGNSNDMVRKSDYIVDAATGSVSQGKIVYVIAPDYPDITIETPNKPAENMDLQAARKEMLELLNEERRKEGAAPLVLDSRLCEAAQLRAEEMPESYSHTRPNGSSCFTVLAELGISAKTMGENIAARQPTVAAVVEAWMNSPGHRANILNEDFQAIGIGVCPTDAAGKYYWTQMFIGGGTQSESKPSGSTSQPAGGSQNTGTSNEGTSSGLTDGTSGSGSGSQASGTSKALTTETARSQLLAAINQERTNVGLNPLVLDAQASEAAQVRAAEQIDGAKLTRPDGRPFETALEEAGVSYQTACECLISGQGTANKIMNSITGYSKFRDNMLSGDVSKVGIGFTRSNTEWPYCSIIFYS